MSGLNLNLNIFSDKQEFKKPTSMLWVDMANAMNTRFAVDIAAKKVTAVVTSDRKICNAINTLRNAKSVIKTYGASESIMCIFNSDNMLSDVIGMEIPQITAENAKAIGIACCENIDETIVDAYEKVKTFFDQIVESAGTFFDRLKTQAETQNAMIDRVISNITTKSIKLDAVSFNSDELFGYTQPVFMERVNALQYINDNFSSLGTSKDELKTLEPYMKVLGYKIVETGTESLLEGDPAAAPAVQIVPETPKEAEQTAPSPDEVMNPQPTVVTPATPAPVEEQPVQTTPVSVPEEPEEQLKEDPKPALTGDPAEVISTEDPVVQTVPAQPNGPADAPQEQTMAVFRWTPSNIVVAAGAIKNVLYSVPKFAVVTDRLSGIRDEVKESIETIQNDIGQKETCESTISNGRSYASFLGDVIAVYNASLNELVDQVVTMSGKLIDNESDNGVAADAITTEDPMGLNAKYVNEEPKSSEQAPSPEEEKGKQADPSGEQPATDPKNDKEPSEGKNPDESGSVKNDIETPKGVPNDKPLDEPAKGVDPNAEAQPGDAEHVEPTETPEEEQTGKKTEPFLGDVFNTRLW